MVHCFGAIGKVTMRNFCMKHFSYIFFLAVIILAACKHEDITPTGGSLSFRGVSSAVSSVRIEHVAYADDCCVLRFTAYPATYKLTETASSGYGTVLDVYCLADGFDFEVGQYELVPESELGSAVCASHLSVYPNGEGDTLSYAVSQCTLQVDSVAEYLHYKFSAVTADGDSISGEYVGRHVVNHSIDRPAFGTLSFDTITCSLAAPKLHEWGSIFSSSTDYFEFVFYSSDSRFADKGNLKSGVQFTLGFMVSQGEAPAAGTYVVSSDGGKPGCLLYGHRLGSTSWGTYWQVYYGGSAIGKANVVADSVSINAVTDESLSLAFFLTDQLGNKLAGSYSGPYTR